jgi:hypothetical protein
MSDKIIPVSTAKEAAIEAGWKEPPISKAQVLRAHLTELIENEGLSERARMAALTKMDELIFWITAGAK